MPTKEITITNRVDDVYVDFDSLKLSSFDGAYGMRRVDTSEVVIADGIDIPHALDQFGNELTGQYQIAITDLLEGVEYEYVIERVTSGRARWETRRFTISVTPAPPLSGGPVFELIPVITAGAPLDLQFVRIIGISTAHGSASTYRGRLYGTATPLDGGNVLLELFNDYRRGAGARVLFGSGQIASEINLDQDNGSGMTATAIVSRIDALARFVAIPTFATDEDVESTADAAAVYDGYDPVYGLARLHASAIEQILTVWLPEAAPMLYPAGPAAAFLPVPTQLPLPDVSRMVNAGALRDVQADLVLYLAGKRREQQQEWRDLANAALVRVRERMADIARASAIAEERAEQQNSANTTNQNGVSVGDWVRG